MNLGVSQCNTKIVHDNSLAYLPYLVLPATYPVILMYYPVPIITIALNYNVELFIFSL